MKRISKTVKVGHLTLGSGAPIAIQSMANTDPHDFEASLEQARAFQAAGCDILRFTVPDQKAAGIFAYLKENGITMPLVADIHFDYRLAIESAAAGADKIRINPGNIGDNDRVRAVVNACRAHGLPIRIGVNSGSLEKEILAKYGAPTAQALAESALYHASLLEQFDFEEIVLSIKSSTPQTMIQANRILAEKCSYPLHLGVTEAGSVQSGTVKSAIGIGALLADGIGDTVRVSLTADPLLEIPAAKSILGALGLLQNGINVVSCPTCGRTKIDLIPIVEEFERRKDSEIHISRPITVAMMGCVVNGPGEAREADIGIAGGKGEAVLFRHGEIIQKIPEEKIVDCLIDAINALE
jgi:(E)-4-hydroxy-3-methylbut-2-enyl-diphosphate synthase